MQKHNFIRCPNLCEIWCLTLREEYKVRVFKNRVLRRILEPKKEEGTERRSSLHNELAVCTFLQILLG
jgi:hypothetical protein